MSRLLSFSSEIPIGFGGASISGEGKGYGFGAISEDESVDLLLAAKELGIKIFDTAPIYGFGISEQRMGKAFKNCREDVFIVSKSGVGWHKDTKRVNMSNSPEQTRSMLEESLRTLNSDYIDLYMIHWPDEHVDIRRPLEILSKAKDQGKIKHIGLCNTNIEDLEKAKEVDHIEAVQSQLNLFETQVVTDLFDYLREHRISFMSWGTLDKGIITGRIDEKRTFSKEDCRASAPWWKKSDYMVKVKKMQKIWPLLDDQGKSGLELALGFNLSFDPVDSVLVGARNMQQLESLVNSVKSRIHSDKLNVYVDAIKE